MCYFGAQKIALYTIFITIYENYDNLQKCAGLGAKIHFFNAIFYTFCALFGKFMKINNFAPTKTFCVVFEAYFVLKKFDLLSGPETCIEIIEKILCEP